MNTRFTAQDLAKQFSIIQGGMGVAVSHPDLAHAVSAYGQFGVVSGTGTDTMMIRRLQAGGEQAERTRAVLAEYPDQEMASWIVENFSEETRPRNGRFRFQPMPKLVKRENNLLALIDERPWNPAQPAENTWLEKLMVAGSYVEVKLAKGKEDLPVGINFLYKIAHPMLPGLYGAMLAGVDAVLMGAGLPVDIPAALHNLAQQEFASLAIPVAGNNAYRIGFHPTKILPSEKPLHRPPFLAIVSNHLAVRALHMGSTADKKRTGKLLVPDGYIVEGPSGGGHNAPPREKADGEFIAFGEKDATQFERLYKILDHVAAEAEVEKLPFWLAGGFGRPEKLQEAFALGAAGVQVGSPFAYCAESGIEDALKQRILYAIRDGTEVKTSALASPTGFPFKVVQIDGTLSEKEVYAQRSRACTERYLVEFYESENNIQWRCPSEPIPSWNRKFVGAAEQREAYEKQTEGRACLCNALIATAGLGSPNEPSLVTGGSESLGIVQELIHRHGTRYHAHDVLAFIEGK